LIFYIACLLNIGYGLDGCWVVGIVTMGIVGLNN
jgi:hypothetical protein